MSQAAASAPASRAGAKLEAALAELALGARVVGARVLHVGAGAAGFTETLLAHGAAGVTAVDVGHAQLRPQLRDDPRVEVLEGVDFRRMPLRVAPGPFDFFAVDVSFAAGRTALRGLAFRLRAGAEGVVLVKPQFELPPRVLASGAGDPARLRQLALERLTEKAEKLGFRVLDVRDSPVTGCSGTGEVLAHMRFDGRPAPGESRRELAAAQRPTPPCPLDWFAAVTPGGEAAAAQEIAALPGVQRVAAVPGGVEFAGDLALGARANLWLRLPTRILLRLGALEAREFAVLRRRAARLPWQSHLRPDAQVCLSVSQRGSRLYHTGAIAENVALALRSALGRDVDVSTRASEGAPLVLVRGERDRWTFSLDASGERLHRRGWRLDAGPASLRETLAALALALCRWDPGTPLADPLCGSGTFAIEAASLALGIAPGAQRRFACESWSSARAELWTSLREEAGAARRERAPSLILASDRDAGALDAARRNAERAGCAAAIRFVHSELEALEPPPGPGLVLLNPPYGRRLGARSELAELYVSLGRALRARFAGWRAGVLVPEPRLESQLGLRVLERHALRNGGLRVALLVCAP